MYVINTGNNSFNSVHLITNFTVYVSRNAYLKIKSIKHVDQPIKSYAAKY